MREWTDGLERNQALEEGGRVDVSLPGGEVGPVATEPGGGWKVKQGVVEEG
jgi:hypothetical protein